MDAQHVAREVRRGIGAGVGGVLFGTAAHVLDLGLRIERLLLRLGKLVLQLGDAVMLGDLGGVRGGFLAQVLAGAVHLGIGHRFPV